MILNVSFSRYYKSCLEPLQARYVTSEMETGGCLRYKKIDIVRYHELKNLQVVLAQCWNTVTNRPKIVSLRNQKKF